MINKPKTVKSNIAPILTTDGVESKNIANFPFASPLGSKIYNGFEVSPKAGDRVPGVNVFYYKYDCGTSQDMNSGVNKAARAYYNYVTQGFTSTQSVFEAPDLIILEMAVCDLALRLLEFKRVYGLMTTYSAYNRYLARSIVTSLGWNYDDLSNNLANARAMYNIRVEQLQKALPIAPNFKWFKRLARLVTGIFTDNVTEKFQVYAFRPSYYLGWSAEASETGSCLVITDTSYSRELTGITPKVWDVHNWFARWDVAFANMLNDTDVNIMCGAIQRVYGDGGLQELTKLEEGYTTMLEYDPGMLKQIQNLSLCNKVVHSKETEDVVGDIVVSQANNEILCVPKLGSYASVGSDATVYTSHLAAALSGPQFITLPYENPSSDEQLEAINLHPVITVKEGLGAGSIIHSCGVIPEFGLLCTYNTNAADELQYSPYCTLNWIGSRNGSLLSGGLSGSRSLAVFFQLAVFDWHPNAIVMDVDNVEIPSLYNYDLSNYTQVGAEIFSSAFEQVNYALLMNPVNTRSTTK